MRFILGRDRRESEEIAVSYNGKNRMKKLLSRLLLLPIYFYRGYISPMTPPSCRFVPTCSEYAIEAIKKHGPFKGLYLAVRRLLRCHPWGGFRLFILGYIKEQFFKSNIHIVLQFYLIMKKCLQCLFVNYIVMCCQIFINILGCQMENTSECGRVYFCTDLLRS